MSELRPIAERDLRNVAALADGSLRGRRREAVEARVRARPELAALLAEQEAAVCALRGIDVEAPATLRSALAGSVAARHARRPSGRALAIGLAGAAAAVAAVVVLALPAGTPGGPSVVQAAALGVRPATQPAPVADHFRPGFLKRSVGGVAYPDWGPGYGWRATGVRTDRIRGRQVVTVFYANRRGDRVAYGIVGGKALSVPGQADVTRRGKTAYRAFARGSRIVVTWERNGHTCVLSSAKTPAAELVELAAFEQRPDRTSY
jgi:hypothetical protein